MGSEALDISREEAFGVYVEEVRDTEGPSTSCRWGGGALESGT